MQIRAINLPPRPPFFSLSLLLLPPPPTHTHIHSSSLFSLGDEVCLAAVQSFPLSQTDREWAEPCGSTLLIFHP